MEANKTTDYEIRLLNNRHHMGTVESGGELHSQFIYDGPKEDIRRIRAACGSCTKVFEDKIYEEDGKTFIPFKYIDNHVSNAGTWERYPNGIINVTKKISIFFEDSSDEFVKSANGPGEVYNPNTANVSAYYFLDVKLK